VFKGLEPIEDTEIHPILSRSVLSVRKGLTMKTRSLRNLASSQAFDQKGAYKNVKVRNEIAPDPLQYYYIHLKLSALQSILYSHSVHRLTYLREGNAKAIKKKSEANGIFQEYIHAGVACFLSSRFPKILMIHIFE
jgi:hypothetical protein